MSNRTQKPLECAWWLFVCFNFTRNRWSGSYWSCAHYELHLWCARAHPAQLVEQFSTISYSSIKLLSVWAAVDWLKRPFQLLLLMLSPLTAPDAFSSDIQIAHLIIPQKGEQNKHGPFHTMTSNSFSLMKCDERRNMFKHHVETHTHFINRSTDGNQ